jgi:2-polyprenyl-3-methyl-5-hydroxy-6-metoxy-1,4-benzoquinol methylase
MINSIFNPDQKEERYYESERVEMLKYIPATSKKILDVGCGSGNFSKLMKSQRDIEVWGLEISKNVAMEATGRVDRVIVGDIEDESLSLPFDYFDCIVFNDVLEHLRYPWNALVRIRHLLQPSGHIVASIPNVRYYPNIKDLLVRKNWQYRDQGILDKTHLRFFTERSMREMFVGCGYYIVQIEGIRECKFSRKINVLNFLLKGYLDDMRYERFAIVALKNESSL